MKKFFGYILIITLIGSLISACSPTQSSSSTTVPTPINTPTPNALIGIETPINIGDGELLIVLATNNTQLYDSGTFEIQHSSEETILHVEGQIVSGTIDLNTLGTDISLTDENGEQCSLVSSGTDEPVWEFLVPIDSKSFTIHLSDGKSIILDSILNISEPTSEAKGSIYISVYPMSDSTLENGIYKIDLENVSQTTQFISFTSPDIGSRVVEFGISPNGAQIAYISGDFGKDRSLWLMQIDGTGAAEIPVEHQNWSNLEWCPDGACLTVVAPDENDDYRIYKVDISSSTIAPLNSEIRVSKKTDGGSYEWAPDGKSLVYCDNKGISSMDSKGQVLSQLIEKDLHDINPILPYAIRDISWSPDGSQIAYLAAQIESGPIGLYLYNLNDKSIKELIPPETALEFLDWSPNGESIVLTAEVDNGRSVLLLNVNQSIESNSGYKNSLHEIYLFENCIMGKPDWRE